MITTEQLNMVYGWAFGSAQKILHDGKQLIPMALTCRFINGKMRAENVIGMPDFSTIQDKERAAAYVKSLIDRPQIDVVCLVLESWYIGPADFDNPTKDEITEALVAGAAGTAPSEHPDRRECVVFQLYTKLFDCSAICEIKRPSNQLVRRELDLSLGTTAGRFSRAPI